MLCTYFFDNIFLCFWGIHMKKSKMIILIGPSGAGKSTLRKYACMKNADISCLVAVTDRGPRQGEIHA